MDLRSLASIGGGKMDGNLGFRMNLLLSRSNMYTLSISMVVMCFAVLEKHTDTHTHTHTYTDANTHTRTRRIRDHHSSVQIRKATRHKNSIHIATSRSTRQPHAQQCTHAYEDTNPESAPIRKGIGAQQ
jgi:hypothetical protein